MLNCFYGTVKSFGKGCIIDTETESSSYIGIILSGSIVIFEDLGPGYQKLLEVKHKHDVFGRVFFQNYGALKRKIGICSIHDCEILFLDYEKILSACYLCCFFHMRFLSQLKALLITYQDK